jgi:ankyrin repeat protein
VFFFKKQTLDQLIKQRKIKALRELLNGDCCNVPDANGHAPLYYAIQYQQPQVARMLLELGATPASGSGSPDRYVMLDVIESGDTELLALFLEFGEYLPLTIANLPLLHFMVTQKWFSARHLELLIEQGYDINLVDAHVADHAAADATGKSALAYLLAQEVFSVKHLELLLKEGADMIQRGHLDEHHPLRVMLENRAIPTCTLVGSFSIEKILALMVKQGLHLARLNDLDLVTLQCEGREEAFVQMLELGLDITMDRELLEKFLYNSDSSSQVSDRLIAIDQQRNLDLPLHLSFYDNKGMRALIESIEPGHPKVHRLFTDLVTMGGMNRSDQFSMLEILLAKGADIDFPRSWMATPVSSLSWASSWGLGTQQHQQLIRWLLDHGAAIECHGRSAFLYAVGAKDTSIARLLGERGAQPDFTEPCGSSVFSKLFSPDPQSEQDASPQIYAELLKLIDRLFEARGLEFPIEQSVDYIDLQSRKPRREIMPCIVAQQSGAKRLALIDALVRCGWDINRRFEHFGYGAFVAQMVRTRNVGDADIRHMLERYPDIDLSVAIDGRPLLYWTFYTDRLYAMAVMKAFIAQCDDVAETHVVTYRANPNPGRWLKEKSLNYLAIALERAASRDDFDDAQLLECCQLLLEAGCNPNEPVTYRYQEDQSSSLGAGRSGQSLLDLAAANCQFEIFKLLLDHGADPHQPSGDYDESCVHYLVYGVTSVMSQEEQLRYLAELDRRGLLDVNRRSTNGATPLLSAAGVCLPKVLRYLLDKGAEIDVVGGATQSKPLSRAICNWDWPSVADRLETVQILLDHGAPVDDVDSDNDTPLMSAATFGCHHVLKELLARGANPNRMNDNGLQAIHYAVMEGRSYDLMPDDENYQGEKNWAMDEAHKLGIIETLVASGAELDCAHHRGGTALIEAMVRGYRELTLGLLKLGANPAAPDSEGRTPMMLAMQFCDSWAINLLSDLPAVVAALDARSNHGENLLHFICRRQEESANELLERMVKQFGLAFVKNDHGVTPLHLASIGGRADMVDFCIKQGVDVNAVDNNDAAPLLYAVSFALDSLPLEHATATVKRLIDAGAAVNAMNAQGYSALAIAKEREFEAIAALLESAGAYLAPQVGF